MKQQRTIAVSVVIQRSGKHYVAFCPDLDVVSQGRTVAAARKNLAEAVALLLETASASEITRRLRSETYVCTLREGGVRHSSKARLHPSEAEG